MTSTTVADALLQRLADAGVKQVFGIPGNHTVALYRGFEAAGITHTTCRHEQGAAFMADGYARTSGAPGVCVLISGPGLLNAATAIAQARADSVPLLVITGVAPLRDLGMVRGTLHELPDQHATAASICRASYTLLDPDNLHNLLDRAFACFTSSRPGPVHIEIPLDLMEAGTSHVRAIRPTTTSPGPDPAAIASAADLLKTTRDPLLLVGGGAADAALEVTRLAELLDCPVLNTVNGKGVCPAGHPLAVGGSPSLPSLRAALQNADIVVAVGTELGETDFDLLMAGELPDTSRWIRIDIDHNQLLTPSPVAVAITSDAKLACAALRAALVATLSEDQCLADQDSARTATNEAPSGRTRRLTTTNSAGAQRAEALRAAVRAEPHFHPEMAAFFATIRDAAPDAVLVGDSTRPTYYAAWLHECPAPRRYFHSVSGFGTLGYALPAAFGAKLATANPVLALVGDGGVQFTLPELSTGAQAGLNVPVIVWNNNGYAEIENSMTARKVPAGSTRILTPDFRLAAAAHHCGYAQPRTLLELGDAIGVALSANAPTLIEVGESEFLTCPSGQWYQ